MPDSNITKKALAAAMKELMSHTAFAKISVSDICDACGMNRKSFYYHFRDKYDLVNWIFYTEFVETLRTPDHEGARDPFRALCFYFHRNRTFYVNALRVTGQDSFREYLGVLIEPVLAEQYEKSFEDDENKDFFLSFFSDAFLLAIERWLIENQRAPDEFVELLRQIILRTAVRVVADLKEEE